MSKTLRSRTHKALIAVLVGTRREAGLTQRDLAKRLKKPHSYVSKIEIGERRLDVGEFVEIAHALKIDPVAMFTRMMQW
jgi:transcriptional regulator with XRE-family HTH domain